MANMYAKFDEEAHNGLFSILFTSSGADNSHCPMPGASASSVGLVVFLCVTKLPVSCIQERTSHLKIYLSVPAAYFHICLLRPLTSDLQNQ